MSPMAEVAIATPLTQLHNIRLHLEQLRLRRNPSVVDALRVTLAGQPLPPYSAFALAPKDKDGKPAYKLSVNDFVIKALAMALQRVPDANVTWTDEAMLRHKVSDVSVAVSIPTGLITPIIRSAHAKSVATISNEMKDLAARAKARKLKPEEYQGASTAVSNLGMYGMKQFTAVINPPQSTILAVGMSEERPVVRNGKIEIATIMTVTLTCDHRAMDGALGAQLLSAFRLLIENPVMMVV
jgi:pyruvate dehydrogenase E2 component (dihydrolipoamide acetyltransferase)